MSQLEARPKILSADSHIVEPADLFVESIDPKFRNRAPKVIETPVRNSPQVTRKAKSPALGKTQPSRNGTYQPTVRPDSMTPLI